jgi:hypothetical protein
MSEQTIEQKLDEAVANARIPSSRTPLEFHSEALKVGRGAADILDKVAEMIAAGDGNAAGDRAALALGYNFDSNEYLVASESAFQEVMYATMRGKSLKDPASESAQYRETANHLRQIADAEARYVARLAALEVTPDAGPAVVEEN